MRNNHLVLVVSALMVLFSTGTVLAYDEEGAKKISEDMKEYGFKDVTTKEGLKFRIPSDMPIETRGGLVSPVPFDEYLYIKFKKIEERVTEVDKKLAEVDKKIEGLGKTLSAIDKKLENNKPAPTA